MKSLSWMLPALAAAGLAASTACDSDDPVRVETCGDLCDQTPRLTPEQDDCIRAWLTGYGYRIDTTPQCLGFTSPTGCRICYDMLAPTNELCSGAWDACRP